MVSGLAVPSSWLRLIKTTVCIGVVTVLLALLLVLLRLYSSNILINLTYVMLYFSSRSVMTFDGLLHLQISQPFRFSLKPLEHCLLQVISGWHSPSLGSRFSSQGSQLISPGIWHFKFSFNCKKCRLTVQTLALRALVFISPAFTVFEKFLVSNTRNIVFNLTFFHITIMGNTLGFSIPTRAESTVVILSPGFIMFVHHLFIYTVLEGLLKHS